jgi:hypothetical protein
MGKYGRWQIVDDIDQGGQATVFRVKDSTGEHLGFFAMKRVLNPKRRERFRNEVHAIATLEHPNVVQLIDNSALDALPSESERQYLVMPIAEGWKPFRRIALQGGR